MTISVYAAIQNGVVENIVLWDGTGNLFSEYETVAINDESAVGIGYSYASGVFTAPAATPLTSAEEVANAVQQKEDILQSINSTTQTWQTQLTLGIITDSDKATLTTWMKYAQEIQAVDTSTAPDITWPTAPSATATSATDTATTTTTTTTTTASS